MAGHSKWAKIKRAKGSKDAKRAVEFGKLSSKITIAVKSGGSDDPEYNFKLKAAIDKAKQAGVPSDTIKRAVDKGASKDEDLKEVTYEGYLPGGVAVMVITATNNTNRTVSEVKNIFTKSSGSVGSIGCVAYMFDKRGEVHIAKENWQENSEEELLELAMEAGADDLDCSDDELAVVICSPENLESVAKNLEQSTKGSAIQEIKDATVPNNTVSVTDLDDAKKIMKAMDQFEDHDDVIDVIANFDIDESLIADLAG